MFGPVRISYSPADESSLMLQSSQVATGSPGKSESSLASPLGWGLDTPQGLEQVARRGEVFAAVQALDAALGVRASLGQAAPGRRMRPAVAAHWRPAGSTLTVHGAPALGSSPRVPPTCFFLKHPGKQPDISRFPSCSLSIESFTTHFCGSISSS